MPPTGRVIAAAVAVTAAFSFVAVRAYERDRARERVERARRFEESARLGPDAARGYWVWAREVEDGAVLRHVTAEDMVPRAGPYGWPGCPRGVLCTATGIRLLALGLRGTAHYVTNVLTSSDYQFHATWAWVEPGLLRFTSRRHYSCAHPDVRDEREEARWLRFRREGDFLHVSVEDFGLWGMPFARERPPRAPARWIVFRRVPRDVFYGRYLLRLCQPREGVNCDADCDSMNLVE